MLIGLPELAGGFDLIGLLAESFQKSHINRGTFTEGVYHFMGPTPDKTEVLKDLQLV